MLSVFKFIVRSVSCPSAMFDHTDAGKSVVSALLMAEHALGRKVKAWHFCRYFLFPLFAVAKIT